MKKQFDSSHPDALGDAPWLVRRTNRRQALRWLAGAASVVPLVGCSSDSSDAPVPDSLGAGGTTNEAGGAALDAGGTTVDAGGMTADAGGTTVDAGGMAADAGSTTVDAGGTTVDAGGITADASVATPDAASALDAGADGSVDGGSEQDAATVVGWASGGTAAMTGKGSYPDPFTGSLTACALVASTTEGPCTTSSDLVREDVSEGWSGLPVRLALQVVDSACQPLSDVTVKIWHTNLEGSYSGQTPNNRMCLSDQGYASMDFFRGVQSTDANGRVFFDTCFPGWYRGRAVHIHFQVKSGSSSYRVSQLFFPEDITEEIFASHPEYVDYGQPDTVFANDNVFSSVPSSERERLILSVSRMSDGAMLASKVVSVV